MEERNDYHKRTAAARGPKTRPHRPWEDGTNADLRLLVGLAAAGAVGADDRPPLVVGVGPVCLPVARGDTPVRANPVPRGLMTRRQGGTMRSRMAPLVRVPRTLPRILSPEEADRLVGALRRHRDRVMALGMLLAGLRRCEVLGLRLGDVQVATGG